MTLGGRQHSTSDREGLYLDNPAETRDRSEDELEHELHVARLAIADARGVPTVPRSVDQPVAGDTTIGTSQVQPVKEVEDLRAELDRVALLDPEVLEDREVHRSEARPVQ